MSSLAPDGYAARVEPGHAAPASAPAEVRQETAVSYGGPTPPPRRGRAGAVVAAIIGIAIAGGALLFVLVYLLTFLGTGTVLTAAILAFVPLGIVFLGARWIDRWEPEPRGALLFAFLWGAGVSVLIALLVDSEIQNVLGAVDRDAPAVQLFQSAVQAPIVEEFGKGLGVLLILWFNRRHFDGPVDGIVYAAWVAGGFAFTENIQYFGIAIAESQGSIAGVAGTFAVRGLMSPFAHVMFTAMTGLLLGVAARRAGAFGAIGFFVLGLIPAVLLHALWNGALFFVTDFYGYYAIVQVPLFILAVVLVVALRRQEAALTYARLNEYAAAGWIAPGEVTALATPAGRRVALAWARQRGAGRIMKRYIRDATRLAFARQRVITGRGRIGAQADEARLLGAVTAARRALMGG
ncbi:RsiW-degrading membrane proteinase PrsW (M82 family) [Diaminobutyricimonas aerilata]|uniref:RsiW-degrading membrane proteinase PrsW (M82 family) n=1 Tax=Diaminobutyricimonas aerilata TaxID=1162967 RepID=A0A2M9CL03_9MICO|nr:PrsW family intramembrane metalloprotease [Diaminobutyricimonas aerilata]PJJ72568.1 RsiW-degrading membrane proteinase PrsW (M82 family) [Diaminobutyricimonas aerilata]